jgi:hypothetical protein
MRRCAADFGTGSSSSTPNAGRRGRSRQLPGLPLLRCPTRCAHGTTVGEDGRCSARDGDAKTDAGADARALDLAHHVERTDGDATRHRSRWGEGDRRPRGAAVARRGGSARSPGSWPQDVAGAGRRVRPTPTGGATGPATSARGSDGSVTGSSAPSASRILRSTSLRTFRVSWEHRGKLRVPAPAPHHERHPWSPPLPPSVGAM